MAEPSIRELFNRCVAKGVFQSQSDQLQPLQKANMSELLNRLVESDKARSERWNRLVANNQTMIDQLQSALSDVKGKSPESKSPETECPECKSPE